MKKGLLIVALAAICYGLNAQSLKLFDKAGKDITNGNMNLWGDTTSYDEVVANIGVKNVSSSSVDVRVKKVESKLTAGAEVYFCWDQCYIPAVYESPTFISVGASQKNDSSFTGHYLAMGKAACDIIYFTFYNDKNKKDSASVRVNFCVSPAGIADNNSKKPSISNPMPNPANGQTNFNYFVPSYASSAKLMLHNMLGETIKEIELPASSTSQTLRTNELNAGMYFYSFVVDGKAVTTKRLMVSH